MRAVSDRRLPDPFGAWIDRSIPLATDVTLLPRNVDLVADVGNFIILGTMFGGMGTMILTLFPWRWDPANDGLSSVLCPGIVCLLLFSVPVLLLRRSWITFWAWRDQRRNRLRQGILFGPEGMLVRLEPNHGYPIPWNRFVVARRFPPEESRDNRKPLTVVETRDGRVDFFEERLSGPAAEINRYVRQYVPSWRPPEPVERRDRSRRKDPYSGKWLLIAAGGFAVAMLTIGGSLLGRIAVGDAAPATAVFEIGLLGGLLLLAVAVVHLMYRVARVKWRLRCPQCGKATTRVDRALPKLHHYCARCNVEWETGWEVRRGGGMSD